MTLKEIQAQYGDGVWLLLDLCGNPIALEGVFSKGVLHWCWSDESNYRSWDYALDASNNFTVLDVEVTDKFSVMKGGSSEHKTMIGNVCVDCGTLCVDQFYLKCEPRETSECTRETCPDIFKGHGPTCKYSEYRKGEK